MRRTHRNFFLRALDHAGIRALLWSAGILSTIRWALPLALKFGANKALKKTPGVSGSVGKVELSLSQGRVGVRDLSLVMMNDSKTGPAVHVDEAQVQFKWKDLFKRKLVVGADVYHPAVLIQVPSEDEKDFTLRASRHHVSSGPTTNQISEPAPGPNGDWSFTIKRAIPFLVDHVAIHNGTVHVQNLAGQNGSDVTVDRINVAVRNITNRSDLSTTQRAFVDGTANTVAGGRIQIKADGLPLEMNPTFNANVKVEGVELPKLSKIINAYSGVNVKSGTFNLYAEAAGVNGRLIGYAKPVLERVEIERTKEKGAGNKVKGLLARAAASILKNPKKDRIASRIEFSGAIDHPEVSMGSAIKSTIRNAFGRAYKPGLEGTVDFTAYLDDDRALLPKKPSRAVAIFRMLKETFSRWSEHNATRLGAALSYYTVFSIAPLLLLAIAIAGLAFGRDAVQGRIVGELGGLLGTQSAEMLQSMIEAARKPSSGIWATIISLFTLLAGASAVMTELKTALNKIWNTTSPSGLKALIKSRLLSFSLVLGIGFLLLVSLVVSAALAAFGKIMGNMLPIPEFVLHLVTALVSFAVITVLFAMLFKFLPDAKIQWHDVWTGAAVTTVLFVVGKTLLGLYLGKGAVGSAYGAAGSILIMLLWIYYSAQILYFGAEFTKVYSEVEGHSRPGTSADTLV